MARFGICTPPQNAAEAKEAGFDYIEPPVPALLELDPDARRPLPLEAANVLLPGELRIVGPDVDEAALRAHVERVCERARAGDADPRPRQRAIQERS